MPTEDYLHQLVHSLSQSEKRYLNLLANAFQQKGQPKHLKLMESLLKLPEYDDLQLKAKLRGTPIYRHLAVEKNYLHRFILKGLRMYHSEGHADAMLADVLSQARILADKGFYPQAVKLLEAERDMAESLGKYNYLIESVRLQKWILIDKAYDNPHQKLEELQQRELTCLESYQQLVHLQQFKERMHQLLTSEFAVRNAGLFAQAQGIIQEPLLAPERNYISFAALHNYHWCYIYYAMIRKDGALGYMHYTALLKAWRENEAWRIREPGEYKKLLSNYLSYCHEQGRFDEFSKVLKEIKAVPVQTTEEEAALFKNLSLVELLYYINTRQWKKAEQMVPYIEEGISRFANDIRESRELAIYYNVFSMYFFQGKYREALDWLMRILNYKRTTFRADIQRAARLLQLLLLYELENYDILDDLIRSAQRYLQRNNAYYSFEEVFMQSLKQLMKADDQQEEPAILEHLLAELAQWPQQAGILHPLGKNEIYCWARARLSHQPIIAIVE